MNEEFLQNASRNDCGAENPAEQNGDLTNLKTESKKYKPTITACFFGYVVQSIVNTFVPLLFLTFQSEFDIPLSQITLLITINFALQLFIDFASAFFIDKIGYRVCAIAANAFSAAGLVSLAVLPALLPNPFAGLLISVLLYATGGGLLEVVISPIVEACPSERKEQTMSLLHSFYCWGCLFVICFSAGFFALFSISNWKILAAIWAILPVINAVLFFFVPLKTLNDENGESIKIPALLKNKTFWLYVVIIMCAGASEQAVSQWASTFVEKSLNLPKSLGDLLGPAFFALCMGTCRLIYGKSKTKIPLETLMILSGGLCVISYLAISLVPLPAVSLAAMGVCGFSVGLLWPGTYSLASKNVKGGNAMFAFLALAGDLGCLSGPTLAGLVSASDGDNLKLGILCAAAFPLLMIAALFLTAGSRKKSE